VLWILLALGVMSASSARPPRVSDAARPVKIAREAAEAVTKQIEQERAEAEEWLRTDPTSYLATIERRDFGSKKTLTVGRAADNDLRLDDPDVAPHHLQVTLEGDRFNVESIDAQAQIKVANQARRHALLEPTSIQVGRFVLRLSHQRFPAIIVFDPKSKRFQEFKGLRYFPVDLQYRYELPLNANPKPETVVIMSTRGNQRRATRVGWFEFMIGDSPNRLEVVRLLEPGVGEHEMQVFFRDTTNGTKSYPLGRYVDVPKLPNGNYLLDFNSAYNPACAFSDHYNCPIPSKANTLKVPVRAGEQDSHYR
jgi:uncharacterized protein (DUF1684 family)